MTCSICLFFRQTDETLGLERGWSGTQLSFQQNFPQRSWISENANSLMRDRENGLEQWSRATPCPCGHRAEGCARRRGTAGGMSDPDDLPRIHDVVGIEGALQGAHDRERLAVLGFEELDLAVARSEERRVGKECRS